MSPIGQSLTDRRQGELDPATLAAYWVRLEHWSRTDEEVRKMVLALRDHFRGTAYQIALSERLDANTMALGNAGAIMVQATRELDQVVDVLSRLRHAEEERNRLAALQIERSGHSWKLLGDLFTSDGVQRVLIAVASGIAALMAAWASGAIGGRP